MRKLFLLAAIGLVLSGCSQNDVPADGPNAQPTQSVPHFYGYALPDDSAPATRGVADGTKIWPKEVVKNGLTVKFLDGSAASQAFVKDAANEWAKYANVKFNFLEDNTQPALVRITFDNASLTSWALTGTDHARVTDQTQATVQFGNWFRLDDRFKRNEVLRAFGQVLGLDLEFRHPKFHPTWITDANGNIDEAKIRTYWEEQLNSFLSWEEHKKYAIDPLEDHSLLIRSTDEYDPNSVMTWPFYEMIAENIPVLDYDDYPVNELSELDKSFIIELYDVQGGNEIATLQPLISFDFTGKKLDMRLTGDKDFAVVWNWDDDKGEQLVDQENGAFYYPTDATGDYTHTIIRNFNDYTKKRVVVCEIVWRSPEAPRPDTSAALSKFDLRSGNNASNFNFEESKNTKLEYIRIVGGSGFPAQTLEFDGWEELKSLYLNQIGDSRIVVKNCLKLSTIATSTHIYTPSSLSPINVDLEPTEVDEEAAQDGAARIVGPEEDPVTDWPELPEYRYSLSNNAGSGLTIENCPNITTLSLENTRLTSLDLHVLKNLNYLYLSSQLNGIVCGGTSSTQGRYLQETLFTLPPCTNTESKGTIILRGINTSLSDYTPIYIKSSIVNSINNRMNTYNWQITWDSGAYPMP